MNLIGQLRPVQSYSSNDGMSPGIVNVIQSDSLGYLWIGCRNGLSRFDGRSFRNYFANAMDSTALPSSEIYSIYPGKEGDIWLGTVKGLVKYNHASNTFQTWDSKNGLTADVIKKVAIQNDSILWVGHWFGLDRINLTTFEVKNIAPFDRDSNDHLNHLSRNHIHALKISPFTKEVFASHQSFLSKYDKSSESIIQLLDIRKISKTEISDFEWLDKHRILILTNRLTEYYIFNVHTKEIDYFDKPDISWIRATKNDKGEIIIVDSRSGPLFWKDHKLDKTSTRTHENASDSKFMYKHLHAGPSNYLWCSNKDGFEQWVTESTELFKFASKVSYHSEYDHEQNVGVTLTYSQPYCWKYEAGEIIKLDYNVNNLHPKNIIFSKYKKKFISINDSEFTIFHPNDISTTTVRLSNKIFAGGISYIGEVEDDLYVSLHKSILKIDNQGQVSTIIDHNQDIFNILVENENSIYFSCVGTLYHFDGSKTHPIYSNSDATRSRGLTITGDTSLWFTQIHLGLVELNLRNNRATTYGSESGIVSQTLYTINRINSDLLIPGSFCLYNFDIVEKKVKEVYSKNKIYGSNHISNEIIKLHNGPLLLTVDQGIIVEPSSKQQNNLYDLDISYIQVGHESEVFQPNQKVKLSHDQNDIFIKLDASYFGKKEDLTFSYSTAIDPINWVEVGNIDEFNFLNLQPDSYVISIKAEDVTGQKLIRKSILTIEILPPFWETLWFRILCLFLLGLIFYSIYRFRITSLKKKYELDKKLIQLENNALKSQMNPHFLFNSLNGIRTLIKLEENEKASIYISYLSKMLRDSLTYYKVALVTLDKEIQMSENYLQLAKLRFGDKLNWKVNIDETINVNSLKVPPFILQPVLENAIWHGIKHINTDGLITISILRDSQYLYLIVEDNGIGLEASSLMQRSNVRTREHLGVKLVEKRLIPLGGTFILSKRANQNGVRAEIKITINEEV
jgi:ligand-binding sensor domain-containing protein